MRIITACLAATFLFLSACVAPDKVTSSQVQAAKPANTGWSVDSVATELAARSCPAGTRYLPPEAIQVMAEPVPFGPATELAKRLPAGVSFAGGWRLTSPNPAFGGLSALAVLPNGDLLSVADVGEFVWLGMKDGKPGGAGKLAFMLGAQGQQLQGKALGDSEGLALRDNLALVSFERTHRVSAFALTACGANAREAQITALPPAYKGHTIKGNLGAEALAVTPSGQVRFGIEHLDNGQSPIGAVTAMNKAEWTGEPGRDPQGYSLVGMDKIKVNGRTQTYYLFRDWDPVRGSRHVIRWGEHEMVLTAPLTPRDNFEGIAAQELETGHIRLWIIADDNFSSHQQTLLYAFDIAPKGQ